jgi:hypothetical protein
MNKTSLLIGLLALIIVSCDSKDESNEILVNSNPVNGSSGIAQEALMAGGPVLNDLYINDYDSIFSTRGCKEKTCSYRKNKLLLKNLLYFALFQEDKATNNFITKYLEAYTSKNAPVLTKLLNLSDEKMNVEIIEGASGINIVVDKYESFFLKLPTPSEVHEGMIIYSENMARLLKMQDILLKNLEKVTPVKRDHNGNDLLKVLMIGA